MLKLAQSMAAVSALLVSSPALATYDISTSGVFQNNPGDLLQGPISFQAQFSLWGSYRIYGNTWYWGSLGSFVVDGAELEVTHPPYYDAQAYRANSEPYFYTFFGKDYLPDPDLIVSLQLFFDAPIIDVKHKFRLPSNPEYYLNHVDYARSKLMIYSYKKANTEAITGLTEFSFSISGAEPPSSGAVPEPSSWALMLAGFAAVGYGLRRRRASVIRFA